MKFSLALVAVLGLLPMAQAQRAQAALLLDQSFLAGFQAVMLACAVSACCGGLAALLLLRKNVAN